MSANHQLRVGIIGIGWYAALNHVPRFRETGRAEIVAISRRNPDRLALAQRELNVPTAYTDWRELLDQAELDAVVISTPNNLHAQPTIAALERGLHVLVEKPLTLTNQEAQAMIQAAQKAQRVLMVGYNSRGMTSWRAVKRVLETGTIGQLRQINVTCCVDMRLLWQEITVSAGIQGWLQSSELVNAFVGDLLQSDNWHFNPDASGGGSFVDIGTHVIDLMLWYADAAATEVMALSQPLGDGRASVVTMQARLANGITLSLTFNDGVSGGDFNFYGQGRMTVYGDHGLLTADWQGFMITEAQEIWVEHDGTREQVTPEGETITPAAAFVATVLDDAPNLAPAAVATRTVALTEAAYRSIETGSSVGV